VKIHCFDLQLQEKGLVLQWTVYLFEVGLFGMDLDEKLRLFRRERPHSPPVGRSTSH
jgi:hypothetical protein